MHDFLKGVLVGIIGAGLLVGVLAYFLNRGRRTK